MAAYISTVKNQASFFNLDIKVWFKLLITPYEAKLDTVLII